MSRFQFRLATLLKIRESDRDERRLRLAEALEAQRILHERIEELRREKGEISRESRAAIEPGQLDIDRVLRVSRYELLLEAQIDHLTKRDEQLREQIELRRDALVEADREVKILEKLRQRRREEFKTQERNLEQKAMDELGRHRQQARS
ncbi:MAG: flagellar export protein FliJ [Planctomycetes bacterium]|nr:flagellar export protein FliJ [Planctomycetota bacterium]